MAKSAYGIDIKTGKFLRTVENTAARPQPKSATRSMYDNPAKGDKSTTAGTPREKL